MNAFHKENRSYSINGNEDLLFLLFSLSGEIAFYASFKNILIVFTKEYRFIFNLECNYKNKED